jgi:hypothetical protein
MDKYSYILYKQCTAKTGNKLLCLMSYVLMLQLVMPQMSCPFTFTVDKTTATAIILQLPISK